MKGYDWICGDDELFPFRCGAKRACYSGSPLVICLNGIIALEFLEGFEDCYHFNA